MTPQARPRLGEARLSLFLVTLAIYLFVLLPVTEAASWQGHALNAGFLVVLFAGAFTGTGLRRLRFVAAGLAVTGMLGTWIFSRGKGGEPLALGLSCTLLFLILTTLSLIRQVFAPGRVTHHRLRGAVAVFLLIGVVWAVAYGLVAVLIPGNSIDSGGATTAGGTRQLFPDQIYFSFVTLTTLGYGDLSPRGAVMRSLAVTEAILGQFYLAILVARLVSLELLHRQGRGGEPGQLS